MSKMQFRLSMAAALAAFGASAADVRLVWHFGTPAKDRVTVTTNALERTADGWRFALPKADVPAGAWALDVIPEFMTARRGDEGWWMDGRGLYGRFDRVSGRNRWWRQQMPIYAVSRGGETWGAHVRTYRFHYDFTVRAAEGRYEVFPRFRFDRVREYFPLYQDLAIDFKRHPGGDRGYVSVAKEYRAYQFARGVRTIRERMRQYPDLKYLSEAMVIRLQTHGAKPIPEKPTDYTKETEPPINVYLPFDKATEFIEGIRAAGVREAAFVSAGWNKGGYDGQLPEHFPVEPVLGGEAGLRRMVSRAQTLGFMVMLHATYTEVYNVCPRFDENDIAKKADGSRVWNGLYFGGSCYWICERRSWEGWIADEMRRMRALGVSGNHYVDVFSATYPNCCADPRHPATAEEMAGYQNRILAEARSVFGGVSSEGGYDHVAANVDCINYVSTEMKKLHDGKTRGLELVDGVRPLWELVYHGTILYCPDRFTQNHTRGQNHAKKDESGNLDWLEGDGIVDPRTVLKMAEFGGRPIFYTYKPKDIPAIRRAYDDFQPLRHLQAELMEDHRELPSGLTVTVFANGEEVVCNYSDGVREYRGRSIQPLTYAILGPFHVDAKATDNFGDRSRTTNSSNHKLQARKGCRK